MTQQTTQNPPKLPHWLDRQLMQTDWSILICLSIFLFMLTWLTMAIGTLVCRHPDARKKAVTLFWIQTTILALSTLGMWLTFGHHH